MVWSVDSGILSCPLYQHLLHSIHLHHDLSQSSYCSPVGGDGIVMVMMVNNRVVVMRKIVVMLVMLVVWVMIKVLMVTLMVVMMMIIVFRFVLK